MHTDIHDVNVGEQDGVLGVPPGAEGPLQGVVPIRAPQTQQCLVASMGEGGRYPRQHQQVHGHGVGDDGTMLRLEWWG